MLQPEHSLIWLMLLAAAAALASFFVFNDESRTARKIILQFFLTIAAPTLLLLGLPLLALSYAVQIDTALWQALIAGLVIATGWLTTAIFTELGKARLKAERLRDYHKAIYAEIRHTLAVLWDEGETQADFDRMLDRMRADEHFVPFVPRLQNDHIYDAIVGEINVLPRQTIDAIVWYYGLIKGIGSLAEDMRGQTFAELAQFRRIAMYQDYFEMRKQAFAYGTFVLALINAYSKGGAQAAEAAQRSAELSSSGAGRSGPAKGSG